MNTCGKRTLDDAKTHLVTNGDGNGLGLGSEDELGPLRVEQVELVRVAAHSSIVLLNKEPADLILADLILLMIGGSGRSRSGGLDGLEVGRGVHSHMSVVVEGLGESMLGRVIAVERSLGYVGHGELRGRVFGLVWENVEKKLK